MLDLWPYVELDSDSSDEGSTYEIVKERENQDYQEQEELVLVPRRNPRRLRWK